MRQLVMEDLVPEVLRIARAAGRCVMGIYEQAHMQVQRKADQSPATEADIVSHGCLVRGLKALGAGWPVVSEEDEASWRYRGVDGRYWLLDPLDGTKEFVSRDGEFTVNIALMDGGCPAFGVVVAPALGLLYWGMEGAGAFRVSAAGEVAIRVAEPLEKARPWRVMASRSHRDEGTHDFIG